MNVIFLTVSRINDIAVRGIYTDLMRKFRDEGHHVYIVYPNERQFGQETSIKVLDGITLLGVKTLNIQKTHFIEKGIATILLEGQSKSAIKNHLSHIAFDLILYSTPPITLTQVVQMLKARNPKAISYLLLKDIFPQNAVDMQMFSKNGILYRFFRKKEITLYQNSDFIGCMSPANVSYVLKHNPYINESQVEVAPNSLELSKVSCFNKDEIRKKYDLPLDRAIFVYGGNLGIPQGIDFLIQCLNDNLNRHDCFFLIVGNGTEYKKLDAWLKKSNASNISLLNRLPKAEYDLLVRSCDVGLIFLDHRFTIPNYPSRLLSYLEYKMPIIAATDCNSDLGEIAEENGYGFWCESNNITQFTQLVNKFITEPSIINEMGESGYEFLLHNYLVDNTYRLIMNRMINIT